MELYEKLAMSKAIMDKHSTMGRGGLPTMPSVSQAAPAMDIPEETLITEEEMMRMAAGREIPQPQSYGDPMGRQRIMNSKLPDAIKQLMIENPIDVPLQSGPTLSDEVIRKAREMMDKGRPAPQPQQTRMAEQVQTRPQQYTAPTYDKNELRSMIREVFIELMAENGMLMESVNTTNETIKFKIGKTLFEGKITKMKKLK